MFSSSLKALLHTLVPPKEHRIPITLKSAPQPLLCYFPYLYLCYLARRPHTYLVRVLLLPLVIVCTFTAAYRYTWAHPSLYVYNWGQCFFALVAVGRSLDMALTPQGMLKHCESQLPGNTKGKPSQNLSNGDCRHANGPHLNDNTHRHPVLPSCVADAFDLAHTLRGLSYKFSYGTYIPLHTRPVSPPSAFLLATLRSFAINYLALDLIESLIKLLPNGIGTTEGGSIFLPPTFAATPYARFAASTSIHLLTGSALISGFGMVYDLITLIAVGIFKSPSYAWPPMMENPWGADSMHAFWARRWHQFLRRTLIVLGGIPGYWIAGELGMLFGAFIASGLFHECSMYAMDRGLDWGGFVFFAIQGPVLLIERLWRLVTGRRVCGWPGRLWVYTVIFVCGQTLTDSWHRRGLGGGMVIPPFFSPTRLLLVPALEQYLIQP
ncbi:hypothetical protein AX17_006219 [Amanita inopinata Kibby_2008]|nr:hypothetical protein AX17_006219 [Amanita inopinata Kibby_2008]